MGAGVSLGVRVMKTCFHHETYEGMTLKNVEQVMMMLAQLYEYVLNAAKLTLWFKD